MKVNIRFFPLAFLIFICGISLLFLILPKEDYSEAEKRNLEAKPVVSWQALAEGSYMDELEEYVADHMPFRRFFVGLKAYYDLYSGRQTEKEIYVGKSGRLYEAPVDDDEEAVRRNVSAINEFVALADAEKVTVMLIPSAGSICNEDIPGTYVSYHDGEIISHICSMFDTDVDSVELYNLFQSDKAGSQLYFATDHHLTPYGAYAACEAFLAKKGNSPLKPSEYEKTVVEGFYGTTYTRSALWFTESEPFEIWKSGNRFAVEINENGFTHDGLIFEEYLSAADKYSAYLGGNQPIIRVKNLSGTGEGKILLIRDSYGSLLACFLADSYEEIILVDLRYYRQPISDLMKKENINEVLVIYGLNNFMKDGNIVRLE